MPIELERTSSLAAISGSRDVRVAPRFVSILNSKEINIAFSPVPVPPEPCFGKPPPPKPPCVGRPPEPCYGKPPMPCYGGCYGR